jgi:hypothetical protein
MDLFKNEVDIKKDIEIQGQNISNKLKNKIDIAGSGKNGIGYFTNADIEITNYSREFLKQIIINDKQRFDRTGGVFDPSANSFLNNSQYQGQKIPIPFVQGDSITFKITLKPPLDQHKIININNNIIPDRSYIIKINLFNNANYIVPTDAFFNGPEYSYPVRQ